MRMAVVEVLAVQIAQTYLAAAAAERCQEAQHHRGGNRIRVLELRVNLAARMP